MLILTIILLVLGVVLLCAEMFMPGFGVCGITGLISVAISAALTIIYMPFGLIIVLCEVVALAVAGYFAFSYIKRRQLYGKLILDETLNTDSRELGDLDYFLGKEGIAKTPLRPHGEVDFNGTPVEVFSDGAYIPEGRTVKVVSVANQKILVKAVQPYNENRKGE